MLERNRRLQSVSHEGCGILCISERLPETNKIQFWANTAEPVPQKGTERTSLTTVPIRCGSSPSALGSALSQQHTVEGLRPVRDQEKLSSNSILKRRFRLGKHMFKIWKDPQNTTFQGKVWWEKGENERNWTCFVLETTKHQNRHVFIKKKVVESKRGYLSFLFRHTLSLLSMISMI